MIITHDRDLTVDPVIVKCAERGVSIARFDLADYFSEADLDWDDFSGHRRVRVRGREVDLTALSSVWYRRPGEPRLREPGVGQGPQGGVGGHDVLAEASAALAGVFRSTDCLWVNRPDSDLVAGFKPYQLSIAERVGFNVPRTLVTNSPSRVRQARQECDLVFKLLGGPLFQGNDRLSPTVLTTRLSSIADSDIDRVGGSMCLLQEYVEKVLEVRLTVIGRTLFPVAIRADVEGPSELDWRANALNPPFAPAPFVPEIIRLSIRSMMDTLRLAFGAFDFVIDAQGKWYFLEVNPVGQFLWLEEHLGMPMAATMADLLIHGRAALDKPSQVVGY